jgi:D-serine deaminase-like pyridoxal phosphate-dependent protein
MQMPTYQYYNQIFKKEQLPLAYLDVNMLKENIEAIALRAGQKNIRIASKSVRCTWVLDFILKQNKQYKGLMCFSGNEAIFLAQKGFDDLLLGYPIIDKNQIREICQLSKNGKKIALMVDLEAHLKLINDIAASENTIQNICIDIDMSSDILGIHFGVNRSAIKNVDGAKKFIDKIEQYPNLKLKGIMGYEAQIAGVGDTNPTNGIKNIAIKFLKKKSIPEYTQRRKDILEYIKSKNITLDFVNAGGTGSMEWNKIEDGITEITVGSGFYAPALFDYYNNFKHLPAAGFAIPIVRNPDPNMYTCLGGGYIASGTVGIDKQPKPYLPIGVKLTENEGLGEVQTPFTYNGNEPLEIGDSILFRHSKAGELCERFNELHLISNGKLIDKVKTYRGEGACFL